MLGSFVAFYRMVVAGGALAAVSFYVFGTGLAFGFGTMYSTIAPDWVYQMLFGEDQQERNFSTINLMNSLSVTIVLMFALPLCTVKSDRPSNFGLKRAFKALQLLVAPLVFVSMMAVGLQLITFPIAENL